MIEATNTSEAGPVGIVAIATMLKQRDGRSSIASGVLPTTWTFRRVLELGTEQTSSPIASTKEVIELIPQKDAVSSLNVTLTFLERSSSTRVSPLCPVDSRTEKLQMNAGLPASSALTCERSAHRKETPKLVGLQKDKSVQSSVGTQVEVEKGMVASICTSAEMGVPVLLPMADTPDPLPSKKTFSGNLADRLPVSSAEGDNSSSLADTQSEMEPEVAIQHVSIPDLDTQIGKGARKLTSILGMVHGSGRALPAEFQTNPPEATGVLGLKNVSAETQSIGRTVEVVRVTECLPVPIDSGAGNVTVFHPLGVAQSSGVSSENGGSAELETLVATPTVLEVGVGNTTHGWLRVRAETGQGGGVTAMLVASPQLAEKLHRELPSLSAFLSREQVGITSLEVSTPAKILHVSRTTLSSSLDLSAGSDAHPGKNADTWTGFEKELDKAHIFSSGPSVPLNTIPIHLTSGRSSVAKELYAVGSGGWLSIRV